MDKLQKKIHISHEILWYLATILLFAANWAVIGNDPVETVINFSHNVVFVVSHAINFLGS